MSPETTTKNRAGCGGQSGGTQAGTQSLLCVRLSLHGMANVCVPNVCSSQLPLNCLPSPSEAPESEPLSPRAGRDLSLLWPEFHGSHILRGPETYAIKFVLFSSC